MSTENQDGFSWLDDQPQTPPGTGSQDPPAPAQGSQTPEGPFLAAGSTVYNTREAAAEGIREKDSLIEKLRQEAISRTGIDPVTGRPVGTAAGGQQPKVPYGQDPARYLEDLAKTATERDGAGYLRTQQAMVDERLGPLAAFIAKAAKPLAIEESVREGYEDMGKFVASPSYREALTRFPLLQQAINAAESDVNAASSLGDLYKIAYQAARGLQVPELLKQRDGQLSPPGTTPHPTLTGSSLPPPVVDNTKPDLNTAEGRKAIIADAQARGLMNLPFGKVFPVSG